MSKQLRLDVAQLTDVGRKRPHNEDNMAYVIPKDPQVMARKGALFIVADGMGGHAAGEVASEIAVDTVSYSYYQDDSEDVATSLLHAIKRANSLIHQRAAENMLRSGMGTTCVAAVLRGNVAYIANVGDSRAYLMRHGHGKQISQDHSWVAEQVRAGLLTEDQARSHAQRNVITRCLGTQADVDVDVFTEQLEEGDSLILCTDGLSGLVGDDELRVIVDQFVPQESVYHLVERANENGGPDNITAIVIHVQEVGWEPPARYPVRVGGGPEMNGDTALLGRLPSTPLLSPMQADGFRTPGGGFRSPTGSLFSPDTITAPQPVVKSRSSSKRLFYPTFLVIVLVVVAFIGSGFYLFFRTHGNITDVDATLNAANASIVQAQKDVNSNPANPTTALQELALARAKLVSVQNSSLNGTQSTLFHDLRNTFTLTVRQAIASYNHVNGIASLPCPATPSTGITADITKYGNMAVFQDATGKKQFYVLADDQQLHPLDGQQLGNKIPVGADTNQVEAITTDNTRLIALVSLPGKGYQLSLLLSQNNGLHMVTSVPITAPTGYIPGFVTMANNSVSVILLQTGSTQPQIVTYTIAGAVNAQHFNPPTKTMTSVSNTIVSVAALTVAKKTQLLFLLSDGRIQSLPLNNGNSLSPGPGSVQITPSIASPLTVSAANFTNVQHPVPTPASKVTSSLTALSVAGATMLATGPTDLYIVAAGVNGVSPRVLDLKAVLTPPSSTIGNAGGGVAPATDTTLYMTLMQQYAISLPTIKGVAADPKGNGFYMLALTGQNAPASQLVSVSLPSGKTCIS